MVNTIKTPNNLNDVDWLFKSSLQYCIRVIAVVFVNGLTFLEQTQFTPYRRTFVIDYRLLEEGGLRVSFIYLQQA
ncbi:pantoate--beta-alanine ligase [Chitinophaga rhizophila]|uniref:pantoate--beta-alanine ligase n=1 Tax=Chitinophaga rhizophila TaxID=2866212 RepID=UPI0037429C9B